MQGHSIPMVFFYLNKTVVTCDRTSHAIAPADIEPDGTGCGSFFFFDCGYVRLSHLVTQ